MKSGRKEGGSGALARKLINGAKEKKGDPLSAREPIAMGIHGFFTAVAIVSLI